MTDITERKAADDRLQHLADHDALTDLLNRRRFVEELELEIAATRRGMRSSAVMVIDIDGFKYVNDSAGHQAGDELIRAVARTLAGRLRVSDAIARLGGDEFACLLRGTSGEEADAVAAELLATLRGRSFTAGEETVRVTVSAGIAALEAEGAATADGVLAAADMAMYEAKHAGRDRVVRFTDDLRAELERGRSWVARLHDALEHDGFELLAQPVDGARDPRGRAARAAAAPARRGRRAVRPGGVPAGRRALRPDRGDRPLGAAPRARPPARGRRRALPGGEPVGALDRPRRGRAARAGAGRRGRGPEPADRRGQGDRGDRGHPPGPHVRRGAGAARLPGRARRLRRGARVVLLAAPAADRLPQDRRRVRRRDRPQPGRPRDRAGRSCCSPAPSAAGRSPSSCPTRRRSSCSASSASTSRRASTSAARDPSRSCDEARLPARHRRAAPALPRVLRAARLDQGRRRRAGQRAARLGQPDAVVCGALHATCRRHVLRAGVGGLPGRGVPGLPRRPPADARPAARRSGSGRRRSTRRSAGT